jgi:hypothetical protein
VAKTTNKIKTMNKFLSVLCAPFMAIANHIDSRPSAGTYRDHVSRLEPRFEETESGIAAALGVKGTEIVKLAEGVDSAIQTKEGSERASFRAGVETGVALVQHSVANLRRSEFKADSAEIRRVEREEGQVAEQPMQPQHA